MTDDQQTRLTRLEARFENLEREMRERHASLRRDVEGDRTDSERALSKHETRTDTEFERVWKTLRGDYVTNDRFDPIQKIVWTLAITVLGAVVAWVLAFTRLGPTPPLG